MTDTGLREQILKESSVRLPNIEIDNADDYKFLLREPMVTIGIERLMQLFKEHTTRAVAEITEDVEYVTREEMERQQRELLDRLTHNIEHGMPVISVEGYEPFENGQYIKVKDALAAIAAERVNLNK